MKKVIKGKMYNTETATEIGGTGGNIHNFYATRETLFVTKKGNYFLHGESSAGGKYGTSDGNTSYGGEVIILQTPQEALNFASEFLPGGIVENHFKNKVEEG